MNKIKSYMPLNLKFWLISIHFASIILGILILLFMNCSGIENIRVKEDAKLVFYIKYELTGYGFAVTINHTADEAKNGEEEILDLYWTATGGQHPYSWSKNIRALEGDTIIFKTFPKSYVYPDQNTLVTLTITINGKTFVETSDPTSIWEEITLKRGMTNVQQHEN